METVCMCVRCMCLHYVCILLDCSSAAINTDMNECVYVHMCVVNVIAKWHSVYPDGEVSSSDWLVEGRSTGGRAWPLCRDE